jgi:hypothetical protein
MLDSSGSPAIDGPIHGPVSESKASYLDAIAAGNKVVAGKFGKAA